MVYLTLLVIVRVYFDRKYFKAAQAIQGLEYRCENTKAIVIELI